MSNLMRLVVVVIVAVLLAAAGNADARSKTSQHPLQTVSLVANSAAAARRAAHKRATSKALVVHHSGLRANILNEYTTLSGCL